MGRKGTGRSMGRKPFGRKSALISSFKQQISRQKMEAKHLKKLIARLERERGFIAKNLERERQRIAEKVGKYKKDRALLEERQLFFAEHEEEEFVKEVNKHLRDAKHIKETPYSLEYWERKLKEEERKLKEADAMLVGPKSVLEVKLEKINGLKAAIKKMQ